MAAAETVTTAPLTMHAFSPAHEASWRVWPILVDRMRRTLPEVDADLPVEPIIGFICQQSLQVPATVRWWLAVQGDAVVGHAIAWVDVSWGDPYILVHQLVADPGAQRLLHDWLLDVGAWGRALNSAYAAADSPLRIREVRFWSARADTPWDRFLNGLVTKTFHVKHLPLERLG